MGNNASEYGTPKPKKRKQYNNKTYHKAATSSTANINQEEQKYTNITQEAIDIQLSADSLTKQIESYTSFEVMSSLLFGFAVSVLFGNIGNDAFEGYYISEIIFSNLMAIVLICNAYTMIVMSLTYFHVNRFMADKRYDIARTYLQLYGSYRLLSRRAFYGGLITFIVAIIIYLYPQMSIVSSVSTTCTLTIGIIVILFTIYTMINPAKVFDQNNPGKLSISSLVNTTTNPLKRHANNKKELINATSNELRIHDIKDDTKDDTKALGFVFNKKLSINDFTFLKVVGKGKIGKVMQVRKNDDSKIYALKVFKKKELQKRKQLVHAQTERNVLSGIDNPFIVSLRYLFQSDRKVYMVLDFFNGGELFFHLKNEGRFSQKRSKFYSG
eukprot:383766_1